MSRARRAAWRALAALEDGRTARLELDTQGLAPRDRGLALELARGVERQRSWLDATLLGAACEHLPGHDVRLLSALRLGAYQVLQLSRVPDHAAVHETVGLVRRGRGFVNAALRALVAAVRAAPPEVVDPRRDVELDDGRWLHLARAPLPDPTTSPAAYLGTRHALPPFLVERWIATFGAEAAAGAAAASARVPALVLCAARGTATELGAQLREEGVETAPLAQEARLLRYTGGGSPFTTEAYRAGAFLVQDPTAHRVVEALAAQPGDTVVDLCAGPGTKASLLALAVGPSGVVHAFDPDPERRAPIHDNAARLQLTDVLRVHDDPAQLPPATRVLVDAPCSNTGVLARRVEVRRRLSEPALRALADRQRELLAQGLRLLAPGGSLVYSTCSVEPEENEAVVAIALAGGAYRLQREQRTLPGPDADGGYFAVLAAVGESTG